ncbi:hydantoinase/oxoprolinase family protein [Geoglobus sp.]
MRTSYSGLDIGGANLKVYGADGSVEIHYFPMWKRWRELERFLRTLDIGENVGVVITAELADAFSSKAEGVKYISNAVQNVFENVVYIDIYGNLRKEVDVPERFAANNWVASVKYLSREYESFIFTDMGSTTTDIIPVVDGEILAGRTDFQRLNRGELLYFGMLRTPTSFLIGGNCSSELFSITADAMVIAGTIGESQYTCETPDGRGKGKRECMQRLARQFCADLDELGEEFVMGAAARIRDEMVERVRAELEGKGERYGISLVIGCGIGEPLLREAAEKAGLEYVSLEERFGEVSKIFPAYAIAKLAENHDCR